MSVATHEPTAFEKGAQLLVQLHELIESGEGDGADADAVRDRMDVIWSQLDEVKIARLDGLSADLYTLGGDSPIVHPPGSHVFTPRASEFLRETELRSDWDAQLEFLRKQPDEVGADLATYVRGFCWTRLGLRDVGMIFLTRAAERDPKFEPSLVAPLIELGREREAVEFCRRLFDKMRGFDPVRIFTIASACSLIATKIARNEDEQHEWIERAVEAAEFGLREYPNWSYLPTHDYLKSPAARFMYETLCWCYLIKGDFPKTRWACGEALKLAPNDPSLRMLDEWLNSQTSPQEADPITRRVLENSLYPSYVQESIPHMEFAFQ